MNGSRISGIRQIVRLSQMVKKWHTMALNRKVYTVTSCALSPTSNRGRVSSTVSDSDEECCRRAAAPPADVPEGYLAVYVGRERKRFVVPTSYLIRPVFRTLLQKAEEEFGFDHRGGLTIPCDIILFEHVLRLLGRNDEEMISLDEVVNYMNCNGAEANSNSGSGGFAA